MSEFSREEVFEKIKNGESFADADLRGVNLSGANLREAYLSGANLERADLSKAELYGADLNLANLSEANLSRTNLIEADLRDADLRGAELTEADLSFANLSGANFSKADLRRADLSFARLHYCDLSGANITGVKFFGMAGRKIKTAGLIWEWLDKSENGDGSEIVKNPGTGNFEDFAQSFEPEIIMSFEGSLDEDLIDGLKGLYKIMQAAKARISEVKDRGNGVATIIINPKEEENIIPIVVLLANAFIKDKKLDIAAIEKDLGDLKNTHVNGKSAFQLLRDIPEIIDLSQQSYDGLAKLRSRHISDEINIRDEKVKYHYCDGKLHIDYSPPSGQRQLEDKSESSARKFARDTAIAASAAAAGTIIGTPIGATIVKILESIFK